MLTGDNSILKRAVDAKERTEYAEAKEKLLIEVIGSYDNYGNIDLEKLKDKIKNTLHGEIIDGDSIPILVEVDGYTFEVSDNGEINYIEGFDKNAPIPEGAVAKMNYKYYSKLQDAIDMVATNNQKETILLLKDISENVNIEENKNIVLNMDSHKITNLNDTPIITLSGLLKVNNGTIMGTYNAEVASILIKPKAKIDFSNTNVSRNSNGTIKKETIELHGALKIDSGKIENTNSCAIWSYTDSDVNIEIGGTAEIYSSATGYVTFYNNTTANTKITGGKITSKQSNAIRQEGILKISGTAEINGNKPTIYTYAGSKTTITGGKITSTKSQAICNNGELNISGTAEVNGTASGYSTISNRVGSKTTITGGKITSTKSQAICNNGELNISGTAEVNGTASGYSTISNQVGSKTTVTGGKISSERYYAINSESNSETKISGGNITSNGNITISNSGNLEVNRTAVISRMAANPTDTSTNGTIVNYSSANILGGQVLSDQGVALFGVGTTVIGSSAYIASGSTEKKFSTVICYKSTTLNGGKIENTAGGYAITGSSLFTNNGGTVIGLID